MVIVVWYEINGFFVEIGKEFVREIKVSADPEFPAALLQEELEEQTRKQRQEFIE